MCLFYFTRCSWPEAEHYVNVKTEDLDRTTPHLAHILPVLPLLSQNIQIPVETRHATRNARVFVCTLIPQCTFLPLNLPCNVAFTLNTQRGEPHDDVTQNFYTGASLLSQFDSTCDALIVPNHLLSPSLTRHLSVTGSNGTTPFL